MSNGCSNVKTIQKLITFLRTKQYVFYKNYIFSHKKLYLQKNICVPFEKIRFCKKNFIL